MKKFLILLLPLLAFTILADWKKLQIDSRASIDFPINPNHDKETLWSVTAAGSRYLIKIDDLKNKGLDSIRFAKVLETPGIIDAFSRGLLSEEGSFLISKKASTWKGYPMFEYEVNPGKTSLFKKVYARFIFVGTKVYGPAVFVNDENLSESGQKFFNSFNLD